MIDQRRLRMRPVALGSVAACHAVAS